MLRGMPNLNSWSFDFAIILLQYSYLLPDSTIALHVNTYSLSPQKFSYKLGAISGKRTNLANSPNEKASPVLTVIGSFP